MNQRKDQDLDDSKGSEWLPKYTAVRSKETRVGAVGIATSGTTFEWSLRARHLYDNLGTLGGEIDALLRCSDDREVLIGLLMISPFTWRGVTSSIPEAMCEGEAMTIRREYSDRVKELLRTRGEWRVRIGCLLYYSGFPDLITAGEFTGAVDVVSDWDEYKIIESEHYYSDLAYLIIHSDEARVREIGLGLIESQVLCMIDADAGLDLAIGTLQPKYMWWYCIVNSAAMFALNRDRLSRIGSDDDLKRIGVGIAWTMHRVALSFESFRRSINASEDFAFPKSALDAILSDAVCAEAFRVEMDDVKFWLELEGVKANWKRDNSDKLVRELLGLYEAKKRKSESRAAE